MIWMKSDVCTFNKISFSIHVRYMTRLGGKTEATYVTKIDTVWQRKKSVRLYETESPKIAQNAIKEHRSRVVNIWKLKSAIIPIFIKKYLRNKRNIFPKIPVIQAETITALTDVTLKTWNEKEGTRLWKIIFQSKSLKCWNERTSCSASFIWINKSLLCKRIK